MDYVEALRARIRANGRSSQIQEPEDGQLLLRRQPFQFIDNTLPPIPPPLPSRNGVVSIDARHSTMSPTAISVHQYRRSSCTSKVSRRIGRSSRPCSSHTLHLLDKSHHRQLFRFIDNTLPPVPPPVSGRNGAARRITPIHEDVQPHHQRRFHFVNSSIPPLSPNSHPQLLQPALRPPFRFITNTHSSIPLPTPK